MLIFHILENLLIIYYASYFLLELLLIMLFFIAWRQNSARSDSKTEDVKGDYGVSIVIPAYNEEVTIIDCVRTLAESKYEPFEIIVVSDGSTDGTMNRLKDAFKLERTEIRYDEKLGAAKAAGIFKSADFPALTVIDKPNGGKADALNAGLNIAKHPFVCTLDADSILDSEALALSIIPFKNDSENKIAVSGGALAVANEIRVNREGLETSRFPRNIWVLFQIIEYLRSFIVSRTGLSKLGGLLIMSGAFALFRKDVLLEAGGFLSPYNHHPYLKKLGLNGARTVCEDMEVVVRVRRYLKEQNRSDRVLYNPRPICWTEVPTNRADLSRQRDRWHRGLMETLYFHRSLMFEPQYGLLGIFALPYYLLFEAFSPVMRIFTYVFISLLLIFGMVNQAAMALLLLAVALIATISMGIITAVVEKWSSANSPVNLQAMRYRSSIDWLKLLGLSILGDFTFAQLRLIWQLKGIYSLLKGKKSWDKFSRKGFNE